MEFEFTPSQERTIQDAVRWYKYSSEQTFEFCGEAGTGKSVVLNEIIRRLGLSTKSYLPMAYTGQAALIMRLKGLTTAKSIHSTLYEFREIVEDHHDLNGYNTQFNRPVKKKVFGLREPWDISPLVTLFVIDEGYMVPKNMKRDIESFGRKILVCGDDGQLPPVNGEPAYFTGGRIHRLTELMRQAKDSPLIYLASQARSGNPINCGLYGNQVLVIEDKDITDDLIRPAQCVVCGTNRTRDLMNDYIRYNIKGIKSDLPVYGERMICRNNNWSIERDNIALANGLIGTVTNSPNVAGFDGDTFKIDFVPDLFPSVFEELELDYKYYKAPYQERKAIKMNEYSIGEKFELAYANTAYLVQGAEFDKGMYIEEFIRPNVQNQLNYTAITRFRNSMIYVKKSKNFSTYISLK